MELPTVVEQPRSNTDGGDVDTASTASVSSNHPDAAVQAFTLLLMKLCRHERVCRRSAPKVQEAKEAIKSQEKAIDDARVGLKHLSRRFAESSSNETSAKKSHIAKDQKREAILKEALQIEMEKFDSIVDKLSKEEDLLQRTTKEQLQLEARIFRATRAYIRNLARMESKEKLVPRANRLSLQRTADRARSRLAVTVNGGSIPPHNMRATVADADGHTRLTEWHEAMMRQDNH